jgi:protein-tyrosine-phosphatase
MAHYLLNKMAADRGLPWEARSAGVAAERYFKVPPGVINALLERGITEIEHTPRLVTRESMKWADLVLGMAGHHVEALHDLFSEHIGKTHLFLEFAGTGTRDVDDPIGQPDEVYQRARDIIEAGIEAMIERNAHAKP